MTLDLVPRFELRQYVYENVPTESLIENIDTIMAAAYSVSAFTRWRPDDAMVWLKSSDEWPDRDWMGGVAATEARHPLADASRASTRRSNSACPGRGTSGYRTSGSEFTPSRGDEIQTEYLIPRRYAVEAVRAVHDIGHLLAPLLLTTEIRAVAADSLWLSCAYERDSLALHFTWALDVGAVNQAVGVVEAALAPFAARPHWGKVFGTSPAQLWEVHPRLADFARLRHELDPTGKFGNTFIDAALRDR